MKTANQLLHSHPGKARGRTEYLASIASQALIAEAELTPKPGLVDRRNSGAHRDMNLQMMRRSALALEAFFAAMALAATDQPVDASLRYELGRLGRDAEKSMYTVTSGTNTHKGAIWLLGLLVAAAAQSAQDAARQIASTAAAIACIPDVGRPRLASHGDLVCARFGIAGARGEAAAGFPHVVDLGLPALRAARAQCFTETQSRISCLLAIMESVNDTCVLYRGGTEGAEFVKQGARRILAVGGAATCEGNQALLDLDQLLIGHHLSPGGSADLFAASLFLDALDRSLPQIAADDSSERQI